MKSFILVLCLLFSMGAFAESVEFAAFTGLERCEKNANFPNGERCLSYLDLKTGPNNTVDLIRDDGGISSHGEIERDDSQHNIYAKTFVKVRRTSSGYRFALESFDAKGTDLVPEFDVDVDTLEHLSNTRKYGPIFTNPYDPTGYYKPFLYLSQPWTSEPMFH